jgi:hypothetical protein
MAKTMLKEMPWVSKSNNMASNKNGHAMLDSD